jgi:SAM-dependent methyltransferase
MAAEKNRDAIFEALRKLLPFSGTVLEIGSGSGQHAVWYARALPSIQWIPSDKDPGAIDSIEAWRRESGLPNLKRAVQIDATSDEWDLAAPVNTIVAIDVAHAAPWPVSVGIIKGAMRWLAAGGRVIFAGPWRVAGKPTPPSLEELDASLRRQDARFGLRDLEELTKIAKARGFEREPLVEYPTACHVVSFRR